MTLYMPVGPPLSGKSMLRGQMLSHNIISEDAVVSPDDIRTWITGDVTNEAHNHEVFDVVNTVINARLSQGLDVYLDATNLVETHRDNAINMARNNHQPFVLILMEKADLEELKCRRDRRVDHPIPDHVLERYHGIYDALDPVDLIVQYHDGDIHIWSEAIFRNRHFGGRKLS